MLRSQVIAGLQAIRHELDKHKGFWRDENTADWYDERYYRISPSKNPMGSANGKYRVLRGGSWSYLTAALRVAARGYHDPLGSSSGGFRCVADVE